MIELTFQLQLFPKKQHQTGVLSPFVLKLFREIVFQLVPNEKAKKILREIESLTVEKVDEVVERFLEDCSEDLLEAKGWPINFSAYIVSKAALNGYTRVMAKNYPKIAVNAVYPGFVKTDFNYNKGKYTVEQGAKGAVMLALMPYGGPSGLFYFQTEESTF